MNLFFNLVVFALGTAVGSFLNNVISLLEKKRTTLWGRSFCPKCRHQLGFFDLLPILSFLFLKRKCRYCGEKISWQYPIVEITTWLIFLLIFNFQFSPHQNKFGAGQAIFNEFSITQFSNLIYLLVISSFLIVVFVYDLKHQLIPYKIIYPAIAIVLIFNFQFSIFNEFSIFKFSIISGLGAAAFFFLIWFVSRGNWMGFGDVELALLLGLFLGFPQILVALFSAFLFGAIIGMSFVILGKKTLKSQIPFGPFLILGTFLTLFFGQSLINWYLNFL